MKKVFKNPVALSIHCWGGLGSQLYALNLAFRLADKFPSRALRIIFHTSGVTRRPLELEKSAIPFAYVEKDDFRFKGIKVTKSDSRPRLRKFIKQISVKSGLLAQANTEQELKTLSRCVIHIRGHYSQLDVASKELNRIGKTIGVFQNEETVTFNVCRIHLRLGDLLTLVEKNPVNPQSVRQAMLRINATSPKSIFQIYSDSDKDEVVKYFAGLSEMPEYTVLDADTKTVIRQCVDSQFFVGSNSKISNWICAFRLQAGRHSFIPASNESQYPSLTAKGLVTFYA